MKKYILPIAVIALLSSCRKDRTCTCTYTQTTNGTGYSGTGAQVVGHSTKREAKRIADCYSYKQTETETIKGTVYVTETVAECKLK
ncbi:MAG: hypothetical protein V4635_15765 [Bacteroidota bacterium]